MQKLIWIIIGLGVVGGLFGWYYTSRLDDATPQQEVEVTHNIDPTDVVSEDPCIINVMYPQPGDTVEGAFEVSGEASNCINWGGVRVYDDMDNVLSAFAITIGETAEEGIAPFFVQPELRFPPETETGYIEVHSADEIVKQRVNIRFDRGIEILE